MYEQWLERGLGEYSLQEMMLVEEKSPGLSKSDVEIIEGLDRFQ